MRTVVASDDPDPAPRPAVSVSSSHPVRLTRLDSDGNPDDPPQTYNATFVNLNLATDWQQRVWDTATRRPGPYRTTAHVGEPVPELEAGA